MIIGKYHNGFAGSIHNHKNYEKMPISYSMYIIKSVFVSATVAFIGLFFLMWSICYRLLAFYQLL